MVAVEVLRSVIDHTDQGMCAWDLEGGGGGGGGSMHQLNTFTIILAL